MPVVKMAVEQESIKVVNEIRKIKVHKSDGTVVAPNVDTTEVKKFWDFLKTK